MNTTPKSPFISYARVNKRRVQQLAHILEAGGYTPWFDHQLIAGISWEEQILNAIKESDCFIFAVSPRSLRSPYCRWELKEALNLGKPILPVVIKGDLVRIPNGMNKIQGIDLDNKGDKPLAVRIAELLNGVQSCIPPSDKIVKEINTWIETQPVKPRPASLFFTWLEEVIDMFYLRYVAIGLALLAMAFFLGRTAGNGTATPAPTLHSIATQPINTANATSTTAIVIQPTNTPTPTIEPTPAAFVPETLPTTLLLARFDNCSELPITEESLRALGGETLDQLTVRTINLPFENAEIANEQATRTNADLVIWGNCAGSSVILNISILRTRHPFMVEPVSFSISLDEPRLASIRSYIVVLYTMQHYDLALRESESVIRDNDGSSFGWLRASMLAHTERWDEAETAFAYLEKSAQNPITRVSSIASQGFVRAQIVENAPNEFRTQFCKSPPETYFTNALASLEENKARYFNDEMLFNDLKASFLLGRVLARFACPIANAEINDLQFAALIDQDLAEIEAINPNIAALHGLKALRLTYFPSMDGYEIIQGKIVASACKARALSSDTPDPFAEHALGLLYSQYSGDLAKTALENYHRGALFSWQHLQAEQLLGQLAAQQSGDLDLPAALRTC